MCVIYACATAFPPEEELRQGAICNGDGAGVAWIEGPLVRWVKGLRSSEEEVLRVIQERNIRPPALIHFRIASVGGKDPSLTHPFPVEAGVGLGLEGQIEGSVLAHNGHIHNWDDYAFRAGLAGNVQFPLGPWSDSRALAWLVYLKGEGVLRFTIGSSRVALLYPNAEARSGWDNLSVWGEWEDVENEQQGWLASTATASKYACKTYTSKDMGLKSSDAKSDGLVIVHGGVVDTTPVSATSRSLPYIWTVEELADLLSTMEGELRDARIAAGLEG